MSSSNQPYAGADDVDQEQHQNSVLDDAHRAAEHMALQWIRSTFREVCYQLWKDHWKVEHVENENGDDEDEDSDDSVNSTPKAKINTPKTRTTSSCRLHLTADMITKAQLTCQRVADKWSQRLEALGHKEFSRWIQQVVTLEGPTLFYVEDHTDTVKSSSSSLKRMGMMNSNNGQSSSTATNTSAEATAEDDDDEDEEDDAQPEAESSESTTAMTCPLAAMKNLKRPRPHPSDTTTNENKDDDDDDDDDDDNNNNKTNEDDNEEEIDPHILNERYVIDQLNEMGIRGETYWPFDWDIIQRAARQLPARLYSRTPGEYNSYQVELVPKNKKDTTTTTTNENDNDNDSDNNDDETLVATNNTQNNQGTQIVVDHPDMPPPPMVVTNEGVTGDAADALILRLKSKHASRGVGKGSGQWASPYRFLKLENVEGLGDVPRPPCPDTPDGSMKIVFDAAAKKEIAGPELDACLQQDNSAAAAATATENKAPPPHTLLGSLKLIGHQHYARQVPEDFKPDELEEWSDKACRRRFQVSVKERLGRHQLQKDPKELKVNTRIKRTWSMTMPTNPDGSTTTAVTVGGGSASNPINIFIDQKANYPPPPIVHRWIDMDLGECVLDLETAEEEDDDDYVAVKEKSRRLYAFSAIEVILLDENEKKGDAIDAKNI